MVKEGTLVEVLQGAKQEIPEILSSGYGGGGGGNSWGQNERSEEDTVNKENEDAQDSRDKWYFFLLILFIFISSQPRHNFILIRKCLIIIFSNFKIIQERQQLGQQG